MSDQSGLFNEALAASRGAGSGMSASTFENTLFFGDNLEILKRHVKDETVDLVYLDPPFKSNQDYNVLFREQDGSRAAAQIKAFGDTWQWDQAAAAAYEEVVVSGGPLSRVMQAFHTMMGENDMLAYLSMMAPRLAELKRVMKRNGSLYLHCDPTASHYLKLLLDAVFLPGGRFVNEIVWHYRKWPAGKYSFQRNHDIILFYGKSDDKDRVFNQLYMERAPSTLTRFGAGRIVSGRDEAGRRLPSTVAEDESLGVRQDDVWEIGRVPPIKQLFPTEKPGALLRRIIEASSEPGQIVLDPFCGCGTAVVSAQELKRRWIGIDVTHLAVTLIKHRLRDAFGAQAKFRIVGEPASLPDAQTLASQDKYQFQWWALGLVGARPVDQKKGADHGIDGRRYFLDGRNKRTEQIIFSVKGGHVGVKDVRDLRGVVERESAAMGVLITLEPPTAPMRREAASARFYKSDWKDTKHPRIQIVTIEELLDGTSLDLPATAQMSSTDRTFKKGAKSGGSPDESSKLAL